MRLLARRRSTAAELKHSLLRQARAEAMTLQQLLPDVESVSLGLAFDTQTNRAFGAHQFTTFPPAQAHFSYACPFGDCDGIYDLNETVFAMLRAQVHQIGGVLHCAGHKARRGARGPLCELGVTYIVTARYAPQQLTLVPLTVLAH